MEKQMNKLEKLGLKYGTDKIGKHNYLPVYYEMFNPIRNNVKKVLEIGVAEGAGLKMFRDFFPNAIIFGAENDRNRVFVDPPIQVFYCDQSKADDIDRLLGKIGTDIDIIIDDGSHKAKDQIFTCLEIFPKLKKGSIYIIEDVAKDSVAEEIRKYYECDTLRVGKRYDDQLVILKK
jgi:hypothetical protein